jgi:hypothetical protein
MGLRGIQRVVAEQAPPIAAEEYSRAALGEGQRMKKQEDATLAVLREYDRWAKDHPNDAKKMGGYVFFGHSEKERPDLLDFRAAGSKWQIVHLWLRHGGRLKD